MKKFIAGLLIGGALAALVAFNVMSKPSITQKDINNEMINAILWMQTSAEYRALCYQAYNTALGHIRAALNTNSDKPLAIILDCDETVIESIAPNTALIDTDTSFDEVFMTWLKDGETYAMPGAAEFLNEVDALGVSIFYVTNRPEEVREPIARIMKALNFPQIDDKHLLLSESLSITDKSPRFNKISSEYNVIVYLGDTAHDFPININGKNMTERNAIADANKDLFGVKYIVLPNPVYGSWFSAIVGSGMPLAEKHKAKIDAMRIWKVYKP